MLNRLLAALVLILVATYAGAQNINISSITPIPNVAYVALNSNITVTFDQNINAATLLSSNVVVRGSFTGVLAGALTGGGTNTITFNPTNNFKPGEVVSVTITKNLLGTSTGQGLVRGHTYSFTALTGASESTPVQFGQRNISFNGALAPHDVKALDIENDGDMDLVLGNAVPFGDQLIIWTNDGNQKFCSLDAADNRIADMHDLDGDGDKDIVSLETNSQGLSWYRNNAGVFTEVNINATILQIYGAQKNVDLDSDGDIDFIVGIGGVGQGISWYENSGTGTFTPRVVFSGAVGGNSYLNVADMDTDGDLDVVAYRQNVSTFAWYENNGVQVFSEHVITPLTTPSTYLEMNVADLDDDGDMDILTGNTNNGQRIVWYVNDGNENFTGQDLTVLAATAPNPRIIDIDGDLDRDVIAGAQWLENNGSEVFTPHKLGEQLQQSNSVDYADMDGDGDIDLVTGGGSLRSQFLWLENTKLMHVTAVSPVNASHVAPANADITITFDQPIDAASVNNSSVIVRSKYRGVVPGALSVSGNTITFNPANDFMVGELVSVAVNDKVRSPSKHSLEFNYGFDFVIKASVGVTASFGTNPTIFTYGATPISMDVADMDGDGDLDIVSCSGPQLHWHKNDGAGNFTQILLTTVGTNLAIGLTDFNRDGRLDIVTRPSASGTGTVYLNDATQSFTATASLPFYNPTAGGFFDVDRDGYDDNFASGYSHFNCGAFAGGGGGTTPSSAGDFNGDGKVDYMFGGSTGQFMNHDGANAFLATLIQNGAAVAAVRADFDGDGDYDVLFPAASTAAFWYRNNLNTASANFVSVASIASIGESRSIATADFDGDGDIDLAGAGVRFGVTVIRNRLNEATANFQLAQTLLPVAGGPNIIRSGDMNGDGKIDVVVMSNVDNTIRWFSNSGVVTLPPTITSFSVPAAEVGDVVDINGTNFSTTPANNTVRFNGTLVSTVFSATATKLRVFVPDGATTGFVTVMVGGNTATSPTQFIVLPQITDMTPAFGPVGTQVVLTGNNFGATPADNKVYFNGTEAVIISASTTSITTTVPVGATTGYIEVHTSAGIASTDDSEFAVITVGDPAPVMETQQVSTQAGGAVSIDLNPLMTVGNGGISFIDISVPPPSGALAYIEDNILIVDYAGIPFTGTEAVVVVVCDYSEQCTEQTFTVEVAGGIVVYNAVSPEGKNPILRLQYVDVLPGAQENKVTIFNRWGDVVFEVDNYNNDTNVFAGVSSKGARLPSGTYYYKVSFTSDREPISGYLELRY